MHDAYEAFPILEKLPLRIECIACYDDTLLVATKLGHLLVYKVRQDRTDVKFEVSLERSYKSFAKKTINQLEVVPEYHILISLSDSVISVHDLSVLAQITCINKTKGATLFAVDLQQQKSLSGDVQYNLRMCVAVKRKLQLYYWKNRDFYELQADLSVPDVPRVMSWSQDSLCLGFKREYFLIEINSCGLKELFPTGKLLEPTVTCLKDGRLALGRDDSTIFLDSEGNAITRYPLTWSDVPSVLVHDPPYIIGVLPNYVEIRTVEPRLLIQSIDMAKPRLICTTGGHVYVASTNFVWRLVSVSIPSQIKQLLHGKEFELALTLAEMTDDPEAEKQKRIEHIQNLFAFDLFCKHKFEESLQLFAKLGTDPSHVIGLYPNLLPQDFRNQLEYPDKIPDLEGGELERGVMGLIEYLTQKRNELLKDMNTEMVSSPIVEGNTIIKSRRQLSQIIDTTLLKCYLQTNDALVAPLLRLKDNNCHTEESERVLKKLQKYSELIILYEKKDLHKQALDVLLRQAQKVNSPLKGHDRTVQYLQRLDPSHMDLIFDYATWVIKAHPEDGLKIFTEDTPEVESFPRTKVLDYLEKTAPDLVVPYLEHLVDIWHDDNQGFHNILALKYKDAIQVLMTDYLDSLPEGQSPASAGKEPGELGELRNKLLFFLETSQEYTPERLLAHFPFDSFFEERAIFLGRLGRHEQALAIYVHVLDDKAMAEEYCRRTFFSSVEGAKNVYLHLLKMYLCPPNPAMLGINMPAGKEPKIQLDAAMQLLKDQPSRIDPVQALDTLPPTIKVSEVLTFLENVLAERASQKRSNQVLKSLIYSEHLQIQEQRMFYQKIKCIITEEKMCRVCKKRIGNSVFARYPNGVVVHFYCCKDRNVCPVE